MRQASYSVLRVGIGITFLWIGILIFRSPELWGNILQPWAVGILPIPLKQAMIQTAVFDIIIGFLLLVDWWMLPIAALGFLHIIEVIVVVGITGATARDIAIAAGLLALIIETWPRREKAPSPLAHYGS